MQEALQSMELVYNSDSYVVVQIELPAPPSGGVARGGYEIVDKFARRECFLQGIVAERFEAGVKELVSRAADEQPSVEAFDEFIAGYTVLAQQPVLMH
jgi:hypothetical protein